MNKQRAQYGETNGEKAKDQRSESPDRCLPIRDYQHLTVLQVRARLDGLQKRDIRRLQAYEKGHKHRKTLLNELDQRLGSAARLWAAHRPG